MPTAWPWIHAASLVSDAVSRRAAQPAVAPWRVHSIYRSVVNIMTTDGILTIAHPNVGGLPNGVMVDLGPDWRTLGLQPGMIVLASTALVRLPGAGLAIGLDTAAHWSPRFAPEHRALGARATRWRRRAAATRALVRQTAPSAGGFGQLLRADKTDLDLVGTLDVARPIVARLIGSLEAGDRRAAADAAGGLVGLGPGLTPSGDDLLVGVEAALHALGSPLAGFVGGALDRLEDRTTAVSATLLRHAAEGEFSARLHLVVGAFLGPHDGEIPAAIARVRAWGATSGTDGLFGVLIGLDGGTVAQGWAT